MTCATPSNLTGWTCNRAWARLTNGTLCSIQSILVTDAMRWSIACDECLTAVVQN
jgi:hypothetical protein